MSDRVKNPLPIPEQCDNCASFDVSFVSNEVLYGRPFGDWPYCYHCSSCGAAVGCHAETRIPLGRMADKKTRQLRAKAHTVFDPLWKSGAMTRTQAYQLLSRHLNIPHKQCHISQLNVEQLQYVIEQCKNLEVDKSAKVIQRRKEKKDAKHVKRIEREKRNRFHNGRRIEQPHPFFRRARRNKKDRGTDFEGN